MARRYLEQKGLVFVAANVRYRVGELDLIMRDGRQWVFVEVRYRRDARFGGAAMSITAQAAEAVAQRGPVAGGAQRQF